MMVTSTTGVLKIRNFRPPDQGEIIVCIGKTFTRRLANKNERKYNKTVYDFSRELAQITTSGPLYSSIAGIWPRVKASREGLHGQYYGMDFTVDNIIYT